MKYILIFFVDTIIRSSLISVGKVMRNENNYKATRDISFAKILIGEIKCEMRKFVPVP